MKPATTRPMTTHNQFELLRERRFSPFFWTQFAGAANDNVYKNALVIFVAYHAAARAALDANTLVNLAAGLFILPFVVLSASAGQLADKYEKSRLIRLIKLFEIGIMVVGALGFVLQSLVLLFAGLFLMGVHSTLFGPVKYSILPQVLRPAELVGGNGLVEMGTFVAILLGTIGGGVLVAVPGVGPVIAGAAAIAIAVAGWLVSRAIPLNDAGRSPRCRVDRRSGRSSAGGVSSGEPGASSRWPWRDHGGSLESVTTTTRAAAAPGESGMRTRGISSTTPAGAGSRAGRETRRLLP